MWNNERRKSWCAKILKGTGTFNFYDGVIKGAAGTSISGTPTEVQPGYKVQKTTANNIETAILVAETSTTSSTGTNTVSSTASVSEEEATTFSLKPSAND